MRAGGGKKRQEADREKIGKKREQGRGNKQGKVKNEKNGEKGERRMAGGENQPTETAEKKD